MEITLMGVNLKWRGEALPLGYVGFGPERWHGFGLGCGWRMGNPDGIA